MDIAVPPDVAKQVNNFKVRKLCAQSQFTPVQLSTVSTLRLQQVLADLEADLQRTTSQEKLLQVRFVCLFS